MIKETLSPLLDNMEMEIINISPELLPKLEGSRKVRSLRDEVEKRLSQVVDELVLSLIRKS